jgi:hypothetical protein
MISQPFVGRFWRKIPFWKGYELQITWMKFNVKVWLQSRNLLKKVFDHILLNKSEISNIFLRQVYIFWKVRMKTNRKSWRIWKKFIIISKNRKTFKQNSPADMSRNKLHSHTQFSTNSYKICTEISEKDHISWIQPVLMDMKFYADV